MFVSNYTKSELSTAMKKNNRNLVESIYFVVALAQFHAHVPLLNAVRLAYIQMRIVHKARKSLIFDEKPDWSQENL